MSDRKRQIEDAWDTLGSPGPERLTGEQGPRQSVLDTFAPPKKRRQWEAENPPMTIRGMARELDERLLEIATVEGITKDWAANVLLHYACHLYETGRLTVNPKPGPRKMTLFPADVAAKPTRKVWWKRSRDPEKSAAARKARRPKKGKAPEGEDGSPEFIASYRLDDELRSKLEPLVKTIRTGDVIVYFLSRAIGDYDAGKLRLVPMEEEAGDD